MLRKEITFDRFVRGLLLLGGLVAAFFALKHLSAVLLPFFIALIVAYMLFPVVRFLQYRCRLRNRVLCIVLTLLLVCGVLTGLFCLVVPPMVRECGHIKEVALHYIDQGTNNASIPPAVQEFIDKNADQLRVGELLRQKDVIAGIKMAAPKVWELFWGTANVLVNIVASLIGLLYLLFLLIDYERMTTAWLAFVPKHRRRFAENLARDTAHRMSGYFRGQMLVALSNCVMFSVGFLLIGFPMPIGLGCFIGLISFIPYVQVVGILPAIVLALLKAAETGANFWWLMGGVLLVYVVVQIIQDVFVTPKVMGKIMGLSPAIILLSLSIWGYMLGILGLIIALPVTTLVFTYYKRYVVKDRQRVLKLPASVPEEAKAEE